MSFLSKAILVIGMSAVGSVFATTFNNPQWGGQNLDWCLYYANQCGQPAADRFCESQGFTHAASFSMQPNISFTRVIGETDRTCWTARDGIRCDGFRYIDCE
jgi:hypothetical protein